MAIYTTVKKGSYQDSLKLMRVSSEVKSMDGVDQAFAFMGTSVNKQTRLDSDLLSPETEDAGPNDLILLIVSESEDLGRTALSEFETKITSNVVKAGEDEKEEFKPVTFEEGISVFPEANLAIISVPGTYATAQAMDALRLGMNVHLFSDNISVEDEIVLKDFAKTKNLLVMGPDCGTSIISGVPICFANKVKEGNIGIVGASGTGIQEFTTLMDSLDLGISHAIGTGGRDLSQEVAARTTCSAIELLENDPKTEIIVVISKPPAKNSEDIIIDALRKSKKPSILVFMGEKTKLISNEPIIYIASTIEEAAAKTEAILKSKEISDAITIYDREPLDSNVLEAIEQLKSTQKYVRGLYTGGTLASEAIYALRHKEIFAYSNISKNKEYELVSASNSQENTIVDLGDDEFTRGSLHPMIDPTVRSQRVMQEFEDQETAVLLCDIVIGFGSHDDPAGILVQDILDAREKTNNNVIVVASIVGTDADPQNRENQVKKLEEVGVLVYPTNQYAAEVAGEIALHIMNKNK